MTPLDSKRYSWTQPVCYDCWDHHHPDRLVPPERKLDEGPDEACCYCGTETNSGIYVRVDPATVAFPRAES